MSPYRVPSIMLGPCINMVLLSQNFACTSENDTCCCCCSVTKSGPALCGPMDWSMPGFPALHYLPEFAQTRVHWVGDAIQPSPPLLPPSPGFSLFQHQGSFQMSPFFASGGQNIGASASASVLLMNTQDWFPLGWTAWISIQSKGLSRAFFKTAVQKHQFFDAQLSFWSNSHIHTWPLKKP